MVLAAGVLLLAGAVVLLAAGALCVVAARVRCVAGLLVSVVAAADLSDFDDLDVVLEVSAAVAPELAVDEASVESADFDFFLLFVVVVVSV